MPLYLAMVMYVKNYVAPGRHIFPSSVLDNDALLITIAVDTRSECTDSMGYMADVGGFKLLVYDYDTDSSWSITNNLFYPYPLQGDFHINGVDFELMDGIFAVTLGMVFNSLKTSNIKIICYNYKLIKLTGICYDCSITHETNCNIFCFLALVLT